MPLASSLETRPSGTGAYSITPLRCSAASLSLSLTSYGTSAAFSVVPGAGGSAVYSGEVGVGSR